MRGTLPTPFPRRRNQSGGNHCGDEKHGIGTLNPDDKSCTPPRQQRGQKAKMPLEAKRNGLSQPSCMTLIRIPNLKQDGAGIALALNTMPASSSAPCLVASCRVAYVELYDNTALDGEVLANPRLTLQETKMELRASCPKRRKPIGKGENHTIR